ncbi:PIPO, partial [Yam mild mosaic virus]
KNLCRGIEGFMARTYIVGKIIVNLSVLASVRTIWKKVQRRKTRNLTQCLEICHAILVRRPYKDEDWC